MPKLAAKDRKKVASSEATQGGFDLIPPGKYRATLKDVEARTSNAGNPMWVAVFNEIHGIDGKKVPGQQWYNLNLPTSDEAPEGYEKGQEKWEQYQNLCAGRIKAFFEAFGYDVDSDTEEMYGEECVIQIGQRTIKSGARAGEKANEVNGVFPLDSVPGLAGGGSSDDGDGDDDF